MSQTETSIAGNPVRTINAQSQGEAYTLPALASGRNIIIRREDSGPTYTVVISIPSGHYLDGALNGTISIPPNSEYQFFAVNPGIWESYGGSGGPDIGSAAATYVPISSLKETITYNADGTVNTVTETTSGAVTTYTYNSDLTPATESRLLNGVTTVRTFAYSNGNLVGVS